MTDPSQIKRQATVLGYDGVHVGTVDCVQGNDIRLTGTDAEAGGRQHLIPISLVYSIDGRQILLKKSADEVMSEWLEC